MPDTTIPLNAAELDEIERWARRWNGSILTEHDILRLVAMARRVEGLEAAMHAARPLIEDEWSGTSYHSAGQEVLRQIDAALTPTTEGTDDQ